MMGVGGETGQASAVHNEVALPPVPKPPRASRPISAAVQAIADLGRALVRTRREQAARDEDDTKPIRLETLRGD